MTDREERQHVIEVLKQMRLDYEDFWEENNTEEIKAFNYAISSIETDLKYDLLYEETSKQADKNDLGVTSGLEKKSKKLENIATTKDNLGVDCISRQATVKRLCNLAEFMNEHKEKSGAPYIMAALFIQDNKTEFPSVTPQEPRWIPVSEKLPNDRDWYLGIFKEPDTGWINPLPFICDYVGRETKATTKEFWILRGFTDRDERIDYYFNLECVAWMPLPKSYSEVEE